MNATTLHSAVPIPATALTAAMRRGLGLLLEAHGLAQDLHQSKWEFAVELPALVEVGCTRSTLRWLVTKGHAEHAIETTRRNSAARSFCQIGNLSFHGASCFLLTPSGIAVARQHGETSAAAVHPRANGVYFFDSEDIGHPCPHWDVELRELRVGDVLIKAFTQPARNQEVILAAFEEDGWPARIDNPLSPRLGRDSKRHLHDAITRLNRHQQHRFIHFRSDNNGEGIRWVALATASPERHQSDG